MAAILIWCPKTHKVLPTGLDFAEQVWDAMDPADTNSISCPHCGGMHQWSKKHGWLQGQTPSIYNNPMMR